MNLSQKLENHLKDSKQIAPGDKVFVACSGGPDSVALFYALKSLADAWKLKLGLLHLNHQLRGRESERDERFVRSLAKQFKIPVYVQRKKILEPAKRNKESIEEFARKTRYQFFVKIAKKVRVSKIVTAHTLDDQAETILMRILQGTGLKGLLGIRRNLVLHGVTFTRPFLDFSKKELLDFLKSERLPFCSDSSNGSKRFVRNRLRLDWLPRLARDFNPRLIETLGRIPAIVEEENQLLDAFEKKAWKDTFKKRTRHQVYLNRASYSSIPSPLQFRVLNRALKAIDARHANVE